jgi:hypothetical protein
LPSGRGARTADICWLHGVIMRPVNAKWRLDQPPLASFSHSDVQ